LAWADVFLLPSICEGSALAIHEALAAGLPVVTTPNSGSVVRDGVDGYVVPVRDVDAIVDRLTRLIDPVLRAEMGRNARARAAEFNKAIYTDRLAKILIERFRSGRTGG
jgi:glycosyltransferase involved in cell wall biosynthesis